jgi:hypothetical protein
MTPAGVGAVPILAPFLAAEGGGGLAAVTTIVGILLYGGIAYATVRLAVRWAEAALSPPSAEGEPRGAARSAADPDRAGG